LFNNSVLSQKRGSSSPKKTNSSNSFKTLPKVSEEPVSAKHLSSNVNEKKNEYNDILELLRRESVTAYKPQVSVPNDPFVDSVAKSFLASQVSSVQTSFCYFLLCCFVGVTSCEIGFFTFPSPIYIAD
jgi:hypothetical protein